MQMLIKTQIKGAIIVAVKIVSTLLMTGAIGLELWNLLTQMGPFPPLPVPAPLLWFTRFALIAHGMEGIIGTVFAFPRPDLPWFYGIYTFFVGTVGIWELFQPPRDPTDGQVK
jgi:hypothetical protein